MGIQHHALGSQKRERERGGEGEAEREAKQEIRKDQRYIDQKR